jgi:hypothetical protein
MVMGEAVKTVPDIIKAASSSLLGILALIILVLACLAYAFFKGASVKVRVEIIRLYSSSLWGLDRPIVSCRPSG